MEPKKLRYYCTIVEQGQISKAAKVLGIAQPALSKHLKDLETTIGTTLITRGGSAWHVTEVGQLLYTRAKNILWQSDNLLAEVTESAAPYNTTLIIGACSVCFSYLATGIANALKTYPQLHYRLFYGDDIRLQELIRKQEVDFAMFPTETRADDLVYRDLSIGSYSIIYPEGVLPYQPSFQLKELQNISLIVPRKGLSGGNYQLFLDKIQEHSGANPFLIDGQDIQTLPLFLDCGIKAAVLLPTSEVHPHLRERYKVSLLDEPDIQLMPCIVYHKEQYLSKAAHFVIEQILQAKAHDKAF